MSRISRLEDRVWKLQREVWKLTMPQWVIPLADAAGVKSKHRDRFYRESLEGKLYPTSVAMIRVYYKAWKKENK